MPGKTTLFASAFAAMLFVCWSFAVTANADNLQLVGTTLKSTEGSVGLVDLDIQDGRSSNFRPTGMSFVGGLTFVPHENQLYGLTISTTTPHANSLVRIDRTTGSTTLVGDTGLNLGEGGLAYDHTTDTLYGINDRGPFGGRTGLFTLNRTSGVATIVREDVSGSDWSALAFDNFGRLFGVTSAAGNDFVTQLDKTTGLFVDSAGIDYDLSGTAGLAFHPLTNKAYLVDGGSNTNGALRIIDVETGSTVRLGGGFDEGLTGLTFIVPEPTHLALLSLPLFGFCVKRQRACLKKWSNQERW